MTLANYSTQVRGFSFKLIQKYPLLLADTSAILQAGEERAALKTDLETATDMEAFADAIKVVFPFLSAYGSEYRNTTYRDAAIKALNDLSQRDGTTYALSSKVTSIAHMFTFTDWWLGFILQAFEAPPFDLDATWVIDLRRKLETRYNEKSRTIDFWQLIIAILEELKVSGQIYNPTVGTSTFTEKDIALELDPSYGSETSLKDIMAEVGSIKPKEVITAPSESELSTVYQRVVAEVYGSNQPIQDAMYAAGIKDPAYVTMILGNAAIKYRELYPTPNPLSMDGYFLEDLYEGSGKPTAAQKEAVADILLQLIKRFTSQEQERVIGADSTTPTTTTPTTTTPTPEAVAAILAAILAAEDKEALAKVVGGGELEQVRTEAQRDTVADSTTDTPPPATIVDSTTFTPITTPQTTTPDEPSPVSGAAQPTGEELTHVYEKIFDDVFDENPSVRYFVDSKGCGDPNAITCVLGAAALAYKNAHPKSDPLSLDNYFPQDVDNPNYKIPTPDQKEAVADAIRKAAETLAVTNQEKAAKAGELPTDTPIPVPPWLCVQPASATPRPKRTPKIGFIIGIILGAIAVIALIWWGLKKK